MKRTVYILMILSAFTSGILFSADWPMYRYDEGRTGVTPAAIPSTLYLTWVKELPRLQRAWPDDTTDIKVDFDESYIPVIAGKKLFIVSSRTWSITAYDTDTGAELWEYFTNAPIRVAPAVYNGDVFVLSDDGYLYSLRASDGVLNWKFSAAPRDRKILGNYNLISTWPGRGGPVISSDGTLYFAAGIFPFMGVYLYSMDPATGDINWMNDSNTSFYMEQPHTQLSFGGIAPQGNLAVNGDKLLVPNGRGIAAAIDRLTGDMIYFNHAAFQRQGGTFVSSAGGLTSNGQRLISVSDGSFIRKLDNGALLDSSVYYTESITAYNNADHSVAWTQNVVNHKPFCKAGTYIYAGKFGSIIAVEDLGTSGSQVWQKDITGTPAHMAAADDKLFVTTKEGYIYCFGETNTGAAPPSPGTYLISEGDTWKYFKGTVFPGNDWNENGFDDSAWLSGPSSFGYGTAGIGTELLDMEDGYMTVYLRKEITIADPASIKGLDFIIDYCDGIVVYINGIEVARSKLLAGQIETTQAEGHSSGTPELFDASAGIKHLVTGANTIAIELHNDSISNSRVLIIPELTSRTGTDPWPAEDSWTTEAHDIVSATGIDEGYVLCLGVGTGRLMEELVRQYGFKVIGIEPDPMKVNTLRAHWKDMNLSGRDISVIQGDVCSAHLPAYIANLIVSEDQTAAGLNNGDVFVARMFHSLRPYGGKVCLSGDHQALFNNGVTHESLANGVVALAGSYTTLERQGALPDTDDWDHLYADPQNSVCSTDKTVKGPFGLLWFGGPSNHAIRGHSPTELVSAGRLYTQGPSLLRAADVYTGRILWEKTLPTVGSTLYNSAREFGTGPNWAAAADALYVCYGTECLKLNPDTGATSNSFTLPDSRRFAQVKIWGDKLVAAVDPFSFTEPVDVGSHMNWNETASKEIYVLNRNTGAVIWSVTADIMFMHNSIIIGNDTVYCNDMFPPAETLALSRRGLSPEDAGASFKIKSFNVNDGTPGWSTDQNVFGTWLAYSESEDILILGGSNQPWSPGTRADSLCEPDAGFRLIAYDAADSHTLLYDTTTDVEKGPYILNKTRLFTQASRAGYPIDIRTGVRSLAPNVLTGLPERWKFSWVYGCNTARGSENLITYRSTTASYYDLTTMSGTVNMPGFRSGCTNNLIAADGVLNSPEYTYKCICAYQVQTSLALIHSPDVETWTNRGTGKTLGNQIKKLGINFGASGNRVAADGVYWVHNPTVVGDPPTEISVITTGITETFKDNGIEFENDNMSWVTASGVKGLSSLEVTLNLTAPTDYLVRLYFREPDGLSPGSRTFDVAIEGSPVLSGFDVAAASGDENVRVTRACAVSVTDPLTIDITPGLGAPVICGVEIIEDTGGPVLNQEPVVYAGNDQEITLPASATLDGTVTDDGYPDPPAAVTAVWTKVSGPGQVRFSNPDSPDTAADFSLAGSYVLRLTASDGEHTEHDEITIHTTGTPGPFLFCSIDTPAIDQYIVTTGSEEIAFSGSATDGTAPYTLDWDFNYTGTFDIDLGNSASGSNVYTNGSYTLALRVTDADTETAVDSITILVFNDNGTPDDFTDDSDWDGDNLPDGWEIDHFSNFNESDTDDPDGDGRDNLTEYNDNTDPNLIDDPPAKKKEETGGCSAGTGDQNSFMIILYLLAGLTFYTRKNK